MSQKKTKSFTILEMIIVLAVIGILMMATTIYLGGTNEKRKVIEAQGCAATLGGELSNFVLFALTSRNLRLDSTTTTSPNYYIIQLTGSTNAGQNCTKTNFDLSGTICNEILLSYDSGDNQIRTYNNLNDGNICHGNNLHLGYFRSGINDNKIDYVKMNKGFSITSDDPNEKRVFGIEYTDGSKQVLGDIVVVLCLNSECENPKQINKFAIDGRSQSITTKICKFYQAENPNKCRERES